MNNDPNKHSSFLAGRINFERASAVSALIEVGRHLVETRQLIPQQFNAWCVEACGMPLARAELLMRAATARPDWSSPLAVDLKDPYAIELEQLAMQQAAQAAGMPFDPADQQS